MQVKEIEREDLKRAHGVPPFKQWHYRTKKGIISLISTSHYSGETWEIYCIKGDFFEDIERFSKREEAENRIRELLEDNRSV